ncbi:hypothetical protein GCM10028807_02250 [Spirosoma daeguense]
MALSQLSFAQVSKPIQVGIQEWAPTNLDVAVFRNGDPIPEARTEAQWKRAWLDRKPAWCYYNNDPANGKKYGKLYNWFAVNDPRGICPDGWRIPSNVEWRELVKAMGNNSAKKLKAKTGWDGTGSGTDQIGFSALPAGARYVDGAFGDLGKYTFFWTATSEPSGSTHERNRAWYRTLSYREAEVDSTGLYSVLYKGAGLSVRCIRRVSLNTFSFKPAGVPNDGIMFVDHEATGRSGHVGLALTECKNGDILAFYMNTNGKIWDGHGTAGWTEYKRSRDGGKTWEKPVILEYSKKIWDQNKNLIESRDFLSFFCAYVSSVVTLPNGDILAMISQRTPRTTMQWQRKPLYMVSHDNGQSWDEPKILDENATIEEVSLTHSDGGTVVHNGVVYSVYIGKLGMGEYSLYASRDNGKTFQKLSDNIFKKRSWKENFYYAAINVIEGGKLIIYGYNQEDEHNLPYIISEDGGTTWSEIKTTYLEKRIRSAQLSDKIGDYYFMSGRSGNEGEEPMNLVLYTSKNGIDWDRGIYLNKIQKAIDSYSALEVIGKYNSTVPKRLLIQASDGYGIGSRSNVKQYWVENIPQSKK